MNSRLLNKGFTPGIYGSGRWSLGPIGGNCAVHTGLSAPSVLRTGPFGGTGHRQPIVRSCHPGFRSCRRLPQQLGHPNQVVGRGHQVPRQTSPVQSPIPGPPEPAHRLHPAKYLLNPFTNPLADRVPPSPRVYSATMVLLYHPPCRMIAESGTPTQATPPSRGGWKQPCFQPWL